jgi:hypothetical protein
VLAAYGEWNSRSHPVPDHTSASGLDAKRGFSTQAVV